MKEASSIDLSEFNYNLPEERIAKFPLEERDASKLLTYRNGAIEHQVFRKLSELLPAGSSLFFNNTKVIPARIIMKKPTEGRVEIFLLNPILPSTIMSLVMEERQSVTWKCMIGNLRRWKQGPLTGHLQVEKGTVKVQAFLEDRENKIVRFEWDDPSFSFAEIVELAGKTPLPPYLNRAATEADKPRYQTVYSEKEGAVAAPTAGLHFTDRVLQDLETKGFSRDFLTLHVSAGTFQPIKTDNVLDHPMHSEQMVVSQSNLKNLLAAKGKIIPVGTTSMRTLESLYWFGARLLQGNEDFAIQKLEPYESKDHPSRTEAFQAILDWMQAKNLTQVVGTTEIFIFPGYQFKVCDGLITNFHQPGSTLMLLVAALVGEGWKTIYNEALNNNYRFLSYGDSSLLLPK